MDTMAREQEEAAAVDQFAALEHRVVRAIELLNTEREQRAAADRLTADLRERLESEQNETASLRRQLEEMHQERDHVRSRVERLMASLEAIETS